MTSDTLPPKATLGFRCKTKLDVDMVDAAMAAAFNIDHQITREQCDAIIRAAMGVLAKASQTSPYSIQKLAWFSSIAGTPFVNGEPLTMEELADAFHKAKASVINPHNQFTKADSNRRGMTDITHGWHNAKPKQLHEGGCIPKDTGKQLHEGGCVVTDETAAQMLGQEDYLTLTVEQRQHLVDAAIRDRVWTGLRKPQNFDREAALIWYDAGKPTIELGRLYMHLTRHVAQLRIQK